VGMIYDMVAVKNCFYFWNHSFTIKYHPSRPLKTRGRKKSAKNSYVCLRCRERSESTIIHSIDGCGRIIRYCTKCSRSVMSIDRKKCIADRREDNWEHIETFREKLAECTKFGTCDILAAHHDALLEDPERLTTDFLIGMVCGDEKLTKYRSTLWDVETQE